MSKALEGVRVLDLSHVQAGPTGLASKAGQLAGSNFLTIREDLDRLAQICRTVLWQGATPITLRAA